MSAPQIVSLARQLVQLVEDVPSDDILQLLRAELAPICALLNFNNPAPDQLSGNRGPRRQTRRKSLVNDTAVQTRVDQAIAHANHAFTSPAILVQDLLDPILLSPPEKAEASAFARIFASYANVPDEELSDIVGLMAASDSILNDIQMQSDKVDAIEDHAGRMAQRHVTLAEYNSVYQSVAFICRISALVETLKFATDWNAIQGPGAKTLKSQFYRLAYLHLMLPNMNTEQGLLRLQTDHAQKYAAWKKSNERIVTARNHLYTAYLSFGAAIFLDPFWTTDNLCAGHRSTLFVVHCPSAAYHATFLRDLIDHAVAKSKLMEEQRRQQQLPPVEFYRRAMPTLLPPAEYAYHNGAGIRLPPVQTLNASSPTSASPSVGGPSTYKQEYASPTAYSLHHGFHAYPSPSPSHSEHLRPCWSISIRKAEKYGGKTYIRQEIIAVRP
ncbi:hypothetical protein K474DRAFT_1707914 [Panus rudis PR-1116 ss-1]|nr:hypothetical protein K474DRAFT_1707914 [Panus rudis PR-1116 ss-1]